MGLFFVFWGGVFFLYFWRERGITTTDTTTGVCGMVGGLPAPPDPPAKRGPALKMPESLAPTKGPQISDKLRKQGSRQGHQLSANAAHNTTQNSQDRTRSTGNRCTGMIQNRHLYSLIANVSDHYRLQPSKYVICHLT